MGQCCVTDDSPPIESQVSEEIKKELEQDSTTTYKILFLGPGGCGKSTIFKQLRCQYNQGFTEADRVNAKEGISQYIIEAMQSLLEINDDELLSPNGLESANVISALDTKVIIDETIVKHIQILWNENCIKATFEKEAKLKQDASCAYFFDNLSQIWDPNYMPSDKDMLLQRRPTTGLIEQKINQNKEGCTFLLVDVGGQRNERRKWIHHFEFVSCVLYVASLSAYDEAMFESPMNSMEDSIKLFHEQINSHWFEKAVVFLVLNKSDIFKEKIKKISLSQCFNKSKNKNNDNNENANNTDKDDSLEMEYSHYNNIPFNYEYNEDLLWNNLNDDEKYNKNLEFIKEVYLAQNVTYRDRKIHVYVTCAYDKDGMKGTFDQITDLMKREGKTMAHSKQATAERN